MVGMTRMITTMMDLGMMEMTIMGLMGLLIMMGLVMGLGMDLANDVFTPPSELLC